MPHGLPGINTKQGMAMGMAMGGSLKRAPSLADSANGLKRQGSKTPGTPKQKELDEHGNIIKKRREKRPSKPMEETTIYYRLCKKEEQADLQQAGYPSPENSHMAEGEDGDEENKGEDGNQGANTEAGAEN